MGYMKAIDMLADQIVGDLYDNLIDVYPELEDHFCRPGDAGHESFKARFAGLIVEYVSCARCAYDTDRSYHLRSLPTESLFDQLAHDINDSISKKGA